MDLTRSSSGHDQAEDPLKIHHPEEEEHHESRASRMFGKVKAKAKKLKNRLTKNGSDGNEHDHDVVDEEEEDDESDDLEPEKHVAPVNEISDMRGYRTNQPESLTHPGETNVPASEEEIIPSGTKDSTTVYSSDYTGRIEPEPLRDATYEHEAPSYPVRTSDVSDREDSRETHPVPLNTPVSLLSETTDDVKTPVEDEFLGGQREVNTERPKRLEDDLSGESTYQSKFPYHTQQGSGEDDQMSGLGTELESGSGIGKDSPVSFGGESETELRKDLPTRSFESETVNDSPTVFRGKQEETGPMEKHDFDHKTESRIDNDGGKQGTELSEDFPEKRHEFEEAIGSGIGEDNGSGKPGTERREDFLGKSYEFDQEIESLIRKDSPTRVDGDETFPARSDDLKVETGLGRDLPTGTDDHFSPEFSGPKERDDFHSQAEQARYEAQEPKLTTYTEMIGSETPFENDKTVATKNAVASSLGYSGETAGAQQENPLGVETVAEELTTDDEDMKRTASPVTMKLPLSGGGSGEEETKHGEDKGLSTRVHLTEKLTPEEEKKEEEEDKAFSDMVAEKLNLGGVKKTPTTNEVEVEVEKIPSDKLPEEKEDGVAVAEEGKAGGGIVGTIKGVYNYWLGGTTEEVKPKSPNSAEESSQSLSSTVGTKGFSDSDESGLGETGGAVPMQKGL